MITKHAIKQSLPSRKRGVDRMLSNNGIDVWESFSGWVPPQLAGRQAALAAMDRTDFDDDLSLVPQA